MDNAIRLYFDENVETEAAVQLKKRGIEAISVRDLGLRGDTDENHLRRATEMGYVVCTYDADYLRLNAEGVAHAGIIYAVREHTTLGDWVRKLEIFCSIHTADDMKNQVEYL